MRANAKSGKAAKKKGVPKWSIVGNKKAVGRPVGSKNKKTGKKGK